MRAKPLALEFKIFERKFASSAARSAAIALAARI